MRTPSSPQELAKLIEHSSLRPETTDEQVAKACREAMDLGFHAVVVNSNKTREAARTVAGSGVKVVATVSFPFGSSRFETKAEETRLAIGDGAGEIDVVADLGLLSQGRHEGLGLEVSGLAEITKRHGALLKVIIETSLLSRAGIATASRVAEGAGADFVKTNTGFGTRGVSVDDVKVIRQSIGDRTGIKAAGGIETAARAIELIEAGATRIGTSRGPQILASFDDSQQSR